MNLKSLSEQFRSRVDDAAAPYLWSDDDVIAYANQAVIEAAERALLIKDATTPEFTKVSIRAGKSEYEIPTQVFFVDRVKLLSVREPLEPSSIEEMDRDFPGWEADNLSPNQYAFSRGLLRIIGTPKVTDSARLIVYRTPACDMASDGDEPEIPVRYHYDLIYWMEHLAYSKRDADTYDPVKAERAEVQFTMKFGVRETASVMRRRGERRSHKVQSSW